MGWVSGIVMCLILWLQVKVLGMGKALDISIIVCVHSLLGVERRA